MDVPLELLTQFCGITNANTAVGTQLLRDSGLDLQTAVHSYFAIIDAAASHPPTPPSTTTTDNHLPICRRCRRRPAGSRATTTAAGCPPTTATARPATAGRPTGCPPPASHVIPPPRHHDSAPNSAPNPFNDTLPGYARSDGLAALFQPPTHLIYPGTFDEALEAGRSQGRWLLVNIQRNDVFACHTINRDVWSDATMQQLLQSHFVFWQRDDGKAGRYAQFYKVGAFPHIAVLDPRSGERVRMWEDGDRPLAKGFMIEQLGDFVSGNSLDSDAIVRGSQTRPAPRPGREGASGAAGSSGAPGGGSSQMDEDAMLAAAISASMEGTEEAPAEDEAPADEAGNGAGPAASERAVSRLLSATDPSLNKSRTLRAEQDDAFLESLALDRAKEESQRSEQRRLENERLEKELAEKQRTERIEVKRKRVPESPPSGTTEKVTELAIRLPDGKRLMRRFYASNNVGNVYDFLDSECEGLSDVSYELMLAYPKKSFADREALLETLPPKAALVVHLKD